MSAWQKLKARFGKKKPPADGGEQTEQDFVPIGTDYPKGHQTGDGNRSDLSVGRILAVAFGISLAGNIAQTGYILYAIEEVIWMPFFLQVQPASEQIINVKPFNSSGDAFDILAEGYAREYVTRFEQVLPDDKTHTAYYANVRWLGARSAKPIIDEMANRRAGVEKAIDAKVVRMIEIVSVFPKGKNYFQVDFRATDTQKNEPIGGGIYHAYMRYEFTRKKMKRKDVTEADLFNPFGWTVVMYAAEGDAEGKR